MPRDSQRSAVYAWEARLCGPDRELLSLPACRALMLRAWRDSVPPGPPPQVRAGNGHRYAYGNSSEIVLPAWARNPHTVLHETAHAVVDYWCEIGGYELPDHGPEFVRVFADFLVCYAGVCPERLARSLTETPRKVRIADPAALPWRGPQAEGLARRRAFEGRRAAAWPFPWRRP